MVPFRLCAPLSAVRRRLWLLLVVAMGRRGALVSALACVITSNI